ncbi:MAG: hypothetical protein ACJ79K_06680 [Gemmatimonadaceae bacterium]
MINVEFGFQLARAGEAITRGERSGMQPAQDASTKELCDGVLVHWSPRTTPSRPSASGGDVRSGGDGRRCLDKREVEVDGATALRRRGT